MSVAGSLSVFVGRPLLLVGDSSAALYAS